MVAAGRGAPDDEEEEDTRHRKRSRDAATSVRPRRRLPACCCPFPRPRGGRRQAAGEERGSGRRRHVLGGSLRWQEGHAHTPALIYSRRPQRRQPEQGACAGFKAACLGGLPCLPDAQKRLVCTARKRLFMSEGRHSAHAQNDHYGVSRSKAQTPARREDSGGEPHDKFSAASPPPPPQLHPRG